MKACKLFVLFFLFLILPCKGQVRFECPQHTQDVARWNALANERDNVKWANSIKNNKLYKTNADGSLEYVYIIQASDTIDIKTVREKTFDYICYYFNMNNESRANMVTNSEGDGVFFQGKFTGIGSFNAIVDYNKINADVTFNIKFKPDRIRFSVKIVNYQVLKFGSQGRILQNYKVYLSNTYPLNERSDHKKSFAMAFINANSNCMSYADKYIEYLNRNATVPSQKVEEEW